ncbi:MAG: hypothetical protein Tsb0020_10290 [Haliangiales bacterium]
MARKRIGEILVQAGVLDAQGLKAALVEQRRWGGQLGRILVDLELISEDALVDALSQQLNFPTVNLDEVEIPDDVIDLISGDLAAQHRLIPFNLQSKFLDVAMSEPTNLGIIDELRMRTQLNVRSYLAGPKMIERAIERYYGRILEEEDPAGPPPPGYRRTTTGSYQALPDNNQAGRGQPGWSNPHARDAEIQALQDRISKLEALVSRDEDVLRKMLSLLVDKGVATREEILERLV